MLNKAMLIGNLGADPEVRYTKNGQAVANFRMATNEVYKDRQGTRQERTEWHNIVAWGQLADFAQNYLKKGSRVYVEGRLQTRDWTDNKDQRHFRTEVVANTVTSLDRPGDGPGQGAGPPADRGGRGQQRGGPPDEGGGGGGDYPGGQEEPYLEDDIPF